MNGSTFPVCACALLKSDASTTAIMLDLGTELARVKVRKRKRKRGIIIAMVVVEEERYWKL